MEINFPISSNFDLKLHFSLLICFYTRESYPRLFSTIYFNKNLIQNK